MFGYSVTGEHDIVVEAMTLEELSEDFHALLPLVGEALDWTGYAVPYRCDINGFVELRAHRVLPIVAVAA